ncbi:hypothetical protein ILFOPFJJ_06906 [Ensifer psoraleae]|nr:hypothetical protein [Sinorhizobium psoraleae]
MTFWCAYEVDEEGVIGGRGHPKRSGTCEEAYRTATAELAFRFDVSNCPVGRSDGRTRSRFAAKQTTREPIGIAVGRVAARIHPAGGGVFVSVSLGERCIFVQHLLLIRELVAKPALG